MTTRPDQTWHHLRLIRVFAVRTKKVWVLSKHRLRSDWADAKTDLNLCFVQTHFIAMFSMSWFKWNACS